MIPSSGKSPLVSALESNLLRESGGSTRSATAPSALPPQMQALVAANAAADSAAQGAGIASALPSDEILLAMMSELAAHSTAPDVRPQENRAATPDDLSSKVSIDSDALPDWPGFVWSNRDGTYNVNLRVDDSKIADIQAVLREQSCIAKLNYFLYPFDDSSIPGLQAVCAGLRQNRGLQEFAVKSYLPISLLPNPDELFLICDAMHDHPTLKSLNFPPQLIAHGDALNKELSHPRSRLKDLWIDLPASQQQLDAFAAALENNRGLTSLTLDLSAHSAPDHERLAKAMATHQALKKLRLNCSDSASDGSALLGALAASNSLAHWKLTVAEFSDRQAISLRDFLARSQNVECIALNWSRLSIASGAQVAAGFDRNLSITHSFLWLNPHAQESADAVEAKAQIDRAIHRAERRNALLQPLRKSALVGHGISAGMAYAPSPYCELALPAEVGMLVAEAVAIHLDLDDADRVYRTLSLYHASSAGPH